MSLDLYAEESDNRIGGMRPVTTPEPGIFDNFLAGSGKVAMQGFAKTGRAVGMALAPIAMALEKAPGSTELQDKYFKAHDEVLGSAVDYWTPKPGEVGVAAEVVGSLASMLPQVIASPALTVASQQLSTGEDLVRKGVDAGKAQAVGAAQAGGLGLGIWMPILGTNGWQRMLLGGAGFNVVQGMATRAASGAILEGTAAAKEFEAFDGTQLTLDVLLGLAFGGLAHLSPAQRAQGEATWKRVSDWAQSLKPSEVDAIVALKQAEHLNVESAPGKPVDLQDIDAHVQRMRQAIDDLANDRPVQVEGMPEARFEADKARTAEAEQIVTDWRAELDAEQKDMLSKPIKQPKPAALPEQPVPKAAEGEPAAPDPLATAATRFAAENPDLPIVVGKNADGSDITTTPRQMLDEADAAMRQAQEDVRLIEIAAGCLLGGGA